jgi:hypothetical protein
MIRFDTIRYESEKKANRVNRLEIIADASLNSDSSKTEHHNSNLGMNFSSQLAPSNEKRRGLSVQQL